MNQTHRAAAILSWPPERNAAINDWPLTHCSVDERELYKNKATSL
jgi:hypothetical protein